MLWHVTSAELSHAECISTPVGAIFINIFLHVSNRKERTLIQWLIRISKNPHSIDEDSNLTPRIDSAGDRKED